MSQQTFMPNQPAPEGTRRKIDIDIATRLFGHKVAVHIHALGFTRAVWTDETDAEPSYEVPLFSSNDSVARLVIDKIKSMGFLVVVKEMPDGKYFRHDMTGADVEGVSVVVELHPLDGPRYRPFKAFGDYAPEVVCKAALTLCDYRDRYMETTES